jgi:hypothetical protein
MERHGCTGLLGRWAPGMVVLVSVKRLPHQPEVTCYLSRRMLVLYCPWLSLSEDTTKADTYLRMGTEKPRSVLLGAR